MKRFIIKLKIFFRVPFNAGYRAAMNYKFQHGKAGPRPPFHYTNDETYQWFKGLEQGFKDKH